MIKLTQQHKYLLIVALFGLLFLLNKKPNNPTTTTQKKMIPILPKATIENTIKDTLKALGFTDILTRLIVAQSKHETNNFTSNQLQVNNSLFGYGKVIGSSFQVEGGGGMHPEDSGIYAKYSNILNSVKDIAAYYRKRLNVFKDITTPEGFAIALKGQGYFTDNITNYQAGLKKFFI